MLDRANIPLRAKISLVISALIMFTFFVVETGVMFGWLPHNHKNEIFGYGCVIVFMPFFAVVVYDFLQSRNNVIKELKMKNIYLEHAAKIIRHDMHSGINTYLPRGINSLKRRLTEQQIKDLNIEAPIKMITEGLNHTRKVYNGVFEFTNLVKPGAVLTTTECNLLKTIDDYLHMTSYSSQVKLDDSLNFNIKINESLFCTGIDNLIRNGLKYNDSDSKIVKVYKQGSYIIIEDNGRGMSETEFKQLSEPYIRKEGQKETGSGLGLNITDAIMKEHGFTISVEKLKRCISDFYRDLEKTEIIVNKNPDGYVYDRESIEEKAKNDGYVGRIVRRRGGGARNNKVFVLYEGQTIDNKTLGRGTKIKIKIK